jgi:hypothetical protein
MNTDRTAVACSSGTFDIRREMFDGRVRVRLIQWDGSSTQVLLTEDEVDQVLVALATVVSSPAPTS